MPRRLDQIAKTLTEMEDEDSLWVQRRDMRDLLAVVEAARDLSDEEFSDGPNVGRLRAALAKLDEVQP